MLAANVFDARGSISARSDGQRTTLVMLAANMFDARGTTTARSDYA